MILDLFNGEISNDPRPQTLHLFDVEGHIEQGTYQDITKRMNPGKDMNGDDTELGELC